MLLTTRLLPTHAAALQPGADAELVPEIVAAKAEGLPISVETCPHYLNFATERVPVGDTRWAADGGGGLGGLVGEAVVGMRRGGQQMDVMWCVPGLPMIIMPTTAS